MPNYWKVKAAQLEWQGFVQARQIEVERAKAIRDAVFTSEGLDPKGAYTFRDADETIEPASELSHAVVPDPAA